jgi:hypothetical protein
LTGGEAFDSPAAHVSGTSTTVGGLADGTTYYFVVQAFNNFDRGISTWAEESATPMAAPVYPGAPTELMASAANSSVRLTWTAPASADGSPITSYNVYVGTSPGGEGVIPLTPGVRLLSAEDYPAAANEPSAERAAVGGGT